MDSGLDTTLLLIVTVAAGIAAQVLASWAKLPGIVFLLLTGLLLGPDGLNWVQPEQLGEGLETLVSLSVALILFEGGLSLDLRNLLQVSGSLRNLITLGAGITILGGAIAAHRFSEFPWPLAFLYGAIVVVTGPTVTTPLLRQVQADPKVSTLLEGEGVLIDPIGAIVAVVVLNFVLSGSQDVGLVLEGLILRLVVGAIAGSVGGGLLALFLRQVRFLSEELRTLVVLAALWAIFGAAQAVVSEAGLLAVVIAGLLLRAVAIPDLEAIKTFKGQLTTLAISILFVLLAADLSIASLFALGWGGPLTVLALMLLVRPLSIGLCTWGSDLNWAQKAFLSWIAPRGIISASVASLFAILLTDRGLAGGAAIKAQVFLTILMTVFLQGLSAKTVAKKLGVLDRPEQIVLVGDDLELRLLAILLEQNKQPHQAIATVPEEPDWESESITLLLGRDQSTPAEQTGLTVVDLCPLDDRAHLYSTQISADLWQQRLQEQRCELFQIELSDRQAVQQWQQALEADRILPLLHQRGEGWELALLPAVAETGDRFWGLSRDRQLALDEIEWQDWPADWSSSPEPPRSQPEDAVELAPPDAATPSS
ncbi:cation:proton antiporter [Synechococcus elongatus]|uniref:Na+/H+ antiporter n=2 Tax=Synechococcus elongatus TaxID=32046 RepID=Q8L1E4_SYNE7|nr:sodium:proton antiporter [Synechococcus elongatus]ABB58424.1 Na+/H+ antiporter [Synechococcus elongatus PCC 7942 = FACHB-805]AJD57113.1 Na+/H+ antiporter [Synechococcus elongatus UTEX 2973]MBD2587145.1 sodium:proton antiporter [Synechococcus elongatus FACHB-242]MBD2688216.1 sodium:proton antiporter [Synechococcus elongatus FACHB-1061]MBD2706073.1 sodium:proton antiporter [Synechococcus elongatus PCC 7942 = FACHB-805]